ncbi:AMP-binding protein [Baekduia soli]|uniref:Long-chain-fatty-acid--CoA ligase n=1 Tax=Baekduia soli TaxID=496014 RepID=A0A5B8U280_9ACTN|nr:AMP-binding protein [Baekduia soli]QEC47050.1 AMP-binding protein [Baekduia soli]
MTAAAAGTLTALLDEVAGRTPDAPAVIERDHAEGVARLSYAELRAAAGAAAAQLAEHGVRRGDVVAVWLPNWTEALVVQYALARLGAVNLGVNTRYGVHEVADLLAQGRPVGIVAPASFLDLDFAGRLRGAMAQLAQRDDGIAAPWVAVVRGTPGDAPGLDAGAGAWALQPAAGTAAPPAVGRPGDLLNCFTTSGSTGVPKLAGHDQAAVADHARNDAEAIGFRPGDVFLGVLPLSGVFGFNPVMGCLAAGGTVLLEPVFDAASVLAGMDELGVTHAVGGDDLLGALKDAWTADPRPLRAFRRGGIADFAGRATEIVAWAERELGASISGLYGSSELFALTAIWPEDLPAPERGRPGGRPVSAGIEVRVADPGSGTALGPGEVGELQFRGYNVLQRYLGRPGAQRAAFTGDGWFRSGDLGALTGEGADFVYTCRAGDALRLRGFLVEPAEIERFLASHESVDVAKVVGVRAGTGEDLAVAYVTARAGAVLEEDALRAFATERLAPFKVPARINVIDAFPVTVGTNGTKIRTAELRRWAAEQLGAGGPRGTTP